MKLFRSMAELYHGLRSTLADLAVQGLLAVTFTLVAVASVFYAIVEGWSLLDAAYFAVVTIATIEYGDLCRRQQLARYSPLPT